MEAHIVVDVKLPPRDLNPGQSWKVIVDSQYSTLEYTSSSYRCVAEIWESRNSPKETLNTTYSHLNGWKYSKLLGLEQTPALSRALVEWTPSWEAHDQMLENENGGYFARREGTTGRFQYRQVLGRRARAGLEECLIDWTPTWEDLAMLNRSSVEDFEKEHRDLLDLLKIAKAGVLQMR